MTGEEEDEKIAVTVARLVVAHSASQGVDCYSIRFKEDGKMKMGDAAGLIYVCERTGVKVKSNTARQSQRRRSDNSVWN